MQDVDFVLIDTWWNVNPIKLVTHCAAALVLIDTWWNVNVDLFLGSIAISSFNRYMVECELKRASIILFALEF